MPLFKYEAYDAQGRKTQGTIEAESKQLAQQSLTTKKLMVSAISPMASSAGSVELFQRKKVSGRDIEYLTSEISLLLESGVRFDKAVALLAKAKSDTPVGDVLATISAKLKSGSGISAAFEEHPELFDSLYINLLQIGEESGALSQVFDGLADDLKFKNDLKQSIVQAITYPAVILVVCLASIVFIFNYIVPKMSVMFDDVAELPFHTQMILALSEWLQQYQGLLLLGLGGLALAGFVARNNSEFVTWLHQTVNKLPFLRNVVAMSERIRFCSSMSLLLNAGIAMDAAVRLSAGNAANQIFRRELESVSEQIRTGTSVSESLKNISLFPELFVSLIEIGEESGEVTRIFGDLAQRTRDEFTTWINRFTSLLEPLLIITMGVIVGGVVCWYCDGCRCSIERG